MKGARRYLRPGVGPIAISIAPRLIEHDPIEGLKTVRRFNQSSMAAPAGRQLNNRRGRHSDCTRSTIRPVPALDDPDSIANREIVSRHRAMALSHEHDRCGSCDGYDEEGPRHRSLLGVSFTVR